MQDNRRPIYLFDLALAARKVGATVPTMDDLVPVFQDMKDSGRTHSIRTNTATMLIGDRAVDAANNYMVLLVRISSTTAPNSVYSDPAAGQFDEQVKVGNTGSGFGCHVVNLDRPRTGIAEPIHMCR